MMHIGILNCFKPADEATVSENEATRFQRFLGQASDQLTFTEYRVTEGERPASPAVCDAYLITGSPQGVYDDEPWIEPLQQFICEVYAAQQKMVGICFGHQVLAHALGGETVKAADKGWGLGLREFEIVEKRPWMNPPLEKGALYFAHQDQVVKLPPAAERLASDTFCPNDMFVIGGQVLGIQGHPEYSPAFAAEVVELIRPHAAEAVVEQALDSIESGEAADGSTFACWVVNFLSDQA